MGRVAETVGKQKSPFPLAERKRSIGCTGSVMVEGVTAADEWVQEAVGSDISHQREPDRKKKGSHSGKERTKPSIDGHFLKTPGRTNESFLAQFEGFEDKVKHFSFCWRTK